MEVKPFAEDQKGTFVKVLQLGTYGRYDVLLLPTDAHHLTDKPKTSTVCEILSSRTYYEIA